MSKAQELKPELLPCPFCGNAEPVAYEQTYYAWVQCRECDAEGPAKDTGQEAIEAWNTRAPASSEQQAAQQDAKGQPRLTVRLTSFPESNGKRNWTALLVREEKWGGLIGNAGGLTVARGELWNRVAYEAERTRFLLGQRGTEPFILDYGDDIETPEEWKGETRLAARASNGGKS